MESMAPNEPIIVKREPDGTVPLLKLVAMCPTCGGHELIDGAGILQCNDCGTTLARIEEPDCGSRSL